MSEEPIPPDATPLVYRDGQWHFSAPPRSRLLCGRYFRPDIGYCVALLFKGSTTANFLKPVYAHSVAAQLRADETDAQILDLADAIDDIATRLGEETMLWELAGRPSGGLESLQWGRA
jgi:hypothetical protein